MEGRELAKKVKLDTLVKSGILLTIALVIFTYTRLPGLDNPYIKAYDPYYFFRVAKTILEKGFWPAKDLLRYWPFGWNSQELTPAVPYALVFFAKISNSLIYAAKWYPFIFGILSIVAIYLIGNRYGFGAYSALLLTLLPAYLYRTSQGFADKEPLSFFLGLISWYFYILYLERKKLPYAILSGIFLGSMAAVWGGKMVFAAPIAAAILVFILLGKADTLLGSSVLILIYLLMHTFVPRYRDVLHSPVNLIFLSIAIAGLVAYFLFKKLKWTRNKVVAAGIVAAFVLSIAAGGFVFKDPFALYKTAASMLENPILPKGKITHSYTVAENQKPHWDWQLKRNQYFVNLGLGIFAIPIALILLLVYGKRDEKEIFLWLVIAILAHVMTYAIRLLIFGAVATALAAGYLVMVLLKHKDPIIKVIGVLVAISMLYHPWIFVMGQAKYMANTSMDTRWYQALKWLEFNTPAREPIVTWWDYGYWIQTVANRTTLGDGGNVGPGYLLNWYTGHFFATSNYTNATAWLRSWNLSYILVDYTMIGKFAAYSLLGHVKNPQGGVGNMIGAMQYRGQITTDLGQSDVYTGYDDDLGPIGVAVTRNGDKVYVAMGPIYSNGYVQFKWVPEEIAYITNRGALLCLPMGYCKAPDLGNYQRVNVSLVIFDYGGKNKIAYIGDTLAMHSTFARLWFFNGLLTDFRPLLDNGEVKIFKYVAK